MDYHHHHSAAYQAHDDHHPYGGPDTAPVRVVSSIVDPCSPFTGSPFVRHIRQYCCQQLVWLALPGQRVLDVVSESTVRPSRRRRLLAACFQRLTALFQWVKRPQL